jgi:hypothetical protein
VNNATSACHVMPLGVRHGAGTELSSADGIRLPPDVSACSKFRVTGLPSIVKVTLMLSRVAFE